MIEMTPEKAETRVVREGYCYLCETDLNEGRGHRDYCPWPNIRAAWEADRSAKKSWEDAVNLTVEMLSQAVPPLTGGGLYRSVERLLKAYLQRQARIEALEKERVAYLKALCQEDSYVVERVTRWVINMRDETTPELAEGVAALTAHRPDVLSGEEKKP